MNKKIVTCDNCNEEFLCEQWRIDKRKNLFCSKKCEGEYKKKASVLNCTCEVCGKLFHRKMYQINKYKHHYCSIKCHSVAKKAYMQGENNHQYGLKGNKNTSWKSDSRISSYGYRLIRNIEHPFSNGDGFVFEHRLVAEKFLLNENNSILINDKRYLSPDYIVHHIDNNKLNNSVGNLQVMELGEHTRMHMAKMREEKMS